MNKIEKIRKELIINGYEVKNIINISDGVNSKTYKIESKSDSYFLKIYSPNKISNLNRLNNEKNFLIFLDKCEFKNVPKVLFSNSEENWLMLSWIKGKKIKKVNYPMCSKLLNFLDNLQTLRFINGADSLPLASDANLSLNSGIASLKKRLNLLSSKKDEIIFKDQSKYQILDNFFSQINLEIIKLKEFQNENNIDLDFSVPKENRIISPSDVGFHNVIHSKNEAIFVDFEYAGWDDPCKLFCDLLLQPDHNIPIQYMDVLEFFFRKYILTINYTLDTVVFMLKLNRIKWSLIILNVVLYKNDICSNASLDLLEIKIKKSINYLENSLLRINFIEKNFLKNIFIID